MLKLSGTTDEDIYSSIHVVYVHAYMSAPYKHGKQTLNDDHDDSSDIYISDFHLIFASVTSQQTGMQALSTTDCPVEPRLLSVLVKVKKILAKRPSQACMKTRVTHVRTGIVCGRKTMMMMMKKSIVITTRTINCTAE